MRQTCVLILASMILLGCDNDKPPAKQPAPAPPAPDVTPKAGGTSAGTSAGSPAIASTAPSTTQTPDPSGATPAVAPVPPARDAEQSRQAQDLLAQAMQAIKDNRLDAAEAALDQIDAMPDSLPRATREQAKTARVTLEKTRKLQTPDPSSQSNDTDNK